MYFVGNLVTEIYFSRSVSGRRECFPCQLALFPSFEYYSFCSAHKPVLYIFILCIYTYIKYESIQISDYFTWIYILHSECKYISQYIIFSEHIPITYCEKCPILKILDGCITFKLKPHNFLKVITLFWLRICWTHFFIKTY